MVRLLRETVDQISERSPRRVPIARIGSPPGLPSRGGGSSFTTSAPRSPRIVAIWGAENKIARSRTRRPSSAREGAIELGSPVPDNVHEPRYLRISMSSS